MKYYINYLKQFGWNIGLWENKFQKSFVYKSLRNPSTEDLSSEEYYY